jgi:hypothetical protein
MNMLFAAVALVLVCALVIWRVPSWAAVRAQLANLFARESAADAGPEQNKAVPSSKHTGKHLHEETQHATQSGKRHTVVEHQARGR